MVRDGATGSSDTSLAFKEILGMTPTRPHARLLLLAALPPVILGAFFLISAFLAQKPPRPGPGEERFEIRTDDARVSDRRISYAVRFLEADAGPWRERLKDQLQPVELGGETDEAAWLLDDAQMRAFMTLNQNAISQGRIRAPKVAAFEGARVTIQNTRDQSYVARLEPVQELGSLGFKPEVKTLTLGSILAFSGVVRPDGVNLTLDLRDEELVAFHDLNRTAESADGRITGQYQVPTTIKQRRRASCTIPKNTTLMISLGFQESSGRPSRPAGTAVALLEAVGAPPLEAHGETTERLVLISPYLIVSTNE